MSGESREEFERDRLGETGDRLAKSGRMTPERRAQIVRLLEADERGYGKMQPTIRHRRELLDELDAVTKERNEWHEKRDALRSLAGELIRRHAMAGDKTSDGSAIMLLNDEAELLQSVYCRPLRVDRSEQWWLDRVDREHD